MCPEEAFRAKGKPHLNPDPLPSTAECPNQGLAPMWPAGLGFETAHSEGPEARPPRSGCTRESEGPSGQPRPLSQPDGTLPTGSSGHTVHRTRPSELSWQETNGLQLVKFSLEDICQYTCMYVHTHPIFTHFIIQSLVNIFQPHKWM